MKNVIILVAAVLYLILFWLGAFPMFAYGRLPPYISDPTGQVMGLILVGAGLLLIVTVLLYITRGSKRRD